MSTLITIISFILIVTLIFLAVAIHSKLKNNSYKVGGSDSRVDPYRHELGDALHKHVRDTTAQVANGDKPYFIHDLTATKYTGGSRYNQLNKSRTQRGGIEKSGIEKYSIERHWTEFTTWEELYKNKSALDVYLTDRANIINNPDIDWTNVLKEINPLLKEKIEYIGLINLEADGRTAKLVKYESSPSEESDMNFASITSELVEKYANCPALFIFHTHPSDEMASPLPSSHDLVTAVHLSALTRFAANIIISSYGVLMYGLDWDGYHTIHESENWDAALTDLSFDIASAHEARRSWVAHTLRNYLDFYPMHQLFMIPFSSSLMVSNNRNYTFYWNVDSPIDHELLDDLYTDAVNAKKIKSQ